MSDTITVQVPERWLTAEEMRRRCTAALQWVNCDGDLSEREVVDLVFATAARYLSRSGATDE